MRARRWAWVGAGALGLVALFVLVDIPTVLRNVLAAADRLGAWGPVLFIVAYVIATVLLIPASILTLGAGAVFGVVWGSIYVSIGATLGAACSFLLGRYFARDWVVSLAAKRPVFAAMDRAVAHEGWKIVGLARLSPIFPFTLINYLFGLTSVSFRAYVLASWIGITPATVLYVYAGSLARKGAHFLDRTRAEEWIFLAVALAASAVITALITRFVRKELEKYADPTDEAPEAK
jgi:uncharacterized membrane protein YdjX (TVP38/TMEM64 family)